MEDQIMRCAMFTFELTEHGLKKHEVSIEEFLAVINSPEPEVDDTTLHFYSSVFDKRNQEDKNAKA
jgi:hypothetical protein